MRKIKILHVVRDLAYVGGAEIYLKDLVVYQSKNKNLEIYLYSVDSLGESAVQLCNENNISILGINNNRYQWYGFGLIYEIKKLSKKKLSRTASMALGLGEIQGYLKGQSDLTQALDLLKQHTRNYAKRQLSWFRHEKDVKRISVEVGESPKVTAAKIMDDWKKGAH